MGRSKRKLCHLWTGKQCINGECPVDLALLYKEGDDRYWSYQGYENLECKDCGYYKGKCNSCIYNDKKTNECFAGS